MDERFIVKTRAAKTLTAAVVIGGTLFATGGTSFASSDYIAPSGKAGEAAVGYGEGGTAAAAEKAAEVDAADGCETKAAKGAYADWHYADGTWSSILNGECSAE